jgi:hypothetical protein
VQPANRTRSRPGRELRTTIVRLRALRTWWTLLTLCLCSGVGLGQPSSHQDAAGWLQLKSDQRRYREEVSPLTPREGADLEHLEQRQQRELRELQSRQRAGRRVERRSERMREPARRQRPGSPAPARGRELERQRLNQRIQREALR